MATGGYDLEDTLMVLETMMSKKSGLSETEREAIGKAAEFIADYLVFRNYRKKENESLN